MQTTCRRNFGWTVISCCVSLFHVGLLLMFISIVSVWLMDVIAVDRNIPRRSENLEIRVHLGISCLFCFICWCRYRKSRIQNWNSVSLSLFTQFKMRIQTYIFCCCFLYSKIFYREPNISIFLLEIVTQYIVYPTVTNDCMPKSRVWVNV